MGAMHPTPPRPSERAKELISAVEDRTTTPSIDTQLRLAQLHLLPDIAESLASLDRAGIAVTMTN
jgi:hypothetical protein